MKTEISTSADGLPRWCAEDAAHQRVVSAALRSAHAPEAHAGPARLAVLEGHVVGFPVAGDRRNLPDRLPVLEYPFHEVCRRLVGGEIGETVLAPPTGKGGRNSRPGLFQRRPTGGTRRCCLRSSPRWSLDISVPAKRRCAIAGSPCPTRCIAAPERRQFLWQEPRECSTPDDVTMRMSDPRRQYGPDDQRYMHFSVPSGRPSGHACPRRAPLTSWSRPAWLTGLSSGRPFGIVGRPADVGASLISIFRSNSL